MEVATWVGAVAAFLAATVAAWQAWSARHARDQAQGILDATREQAEAAKQQATAAAESVELAREQLALAWRQAGNVGDVKAEWVKNWVRGPVFGLLRLEAQGHHVLTDVRVEIVPPEEIVTPEGGPTPTVAFVGPNPAEPSEPPVGVPTDEAAHDELHVKVELGDLEPGRPWHAQVLCLSTGADSFAIILEWSVGSSPERERTRANLRLPPPSPPTATIV